ncbi:Helicase domain protein [Mesorhizobium sp. ORS 3359]|nr:Helicase domain protein [Mesorhizobium sp. ORS 3359]
MRPTVRLTLKYALRSWQQVALKKWDASRRGVISVVTGGGKTVFAEACITNFLATYPSGQILILVPTTALLDQWCLSLQEELGLVSEDISLLSASDTPIPAAPITIAVINSARDLSGKWGLDGSPKMLIVDECHRAGSPVNAKALRGHYEATLGLSATPVREYDEGFEQYISPALGPIIYEYDYASAYRDGVITPFELHNVQIQFLPDELEKYNRLSKRIRAAASSDKGAAQIGESDHLKRLLQQRAAVSATATMRIPVAVKLVERHKSERLIVFHERTDSADKIFEILKERGHSVAIYHAGLGAPLRRENLRLFRKGVYDVLVCCRALDEGMNVPETSVAVIASSTASQRQRIQRLGRILRPAKGKISATVYTLYATKEEAERLSDESLALADIVTSTWHKGRVERYD